MKKDIFVCCVFGVLCFTVVLCMAFSSGATSKKPISIKAGQKKAPPSTELSITPDDVARWCKNNPGDCNVQSSDNYPTLTQREMGCIDTLGDNNGTITANEYEQYNAQCP